MIEKENTGKESLFMILDVLEELKITYWVDGGWGIDILIGKQTREHRDVDIDFDAAFEAILIGRLEEMGYKIMTDWRPARVELFHPMHGYIDIHPLIISDSGEAKQADLEGGWYPFKAEYFSEALFEGRIIPCISLEAQRIFHSGYELREVDKEDLKKLKELENTNNMISSIIGIAFDCPNANELADFYVKLSGWEKEISSDEFAALRTPQGILLVFQTVENYTPPVWPWKENAQQQMAHIDFKVDDLQKAVEYALQCGAKKAEVQYYNTSTVMLDPAGHPFCLSTVQQ